MAQFAAAEREALDKIREIAVHQLRDQKFFEIKIHELSVSEELARKKLEELHMKQAQEKTGKYF